MCNNTLRYSEPYPSVVFVQYKLNTNFCSIQTGLQTVGFSRLQTTCHKFRDQFARIYYRIVYIILSHDTRTNPL